MIVFSNSLCIEVKIACTSRLNFISQQIRNILSSARRQKIQNSGLRRHPLSLAMNSFQTSFVASHLGHDPSNPMGSGQPGPQTITGQAIEVAGRNVETMIHGDSQYPSLAEKLRLG